MTWQARLKALVGALLGLQHVHNMQYLHWDIKPHNVLIDENGTDGFFDGFVLTCGRVIQARLTWLIVASPRRWTDQGTTP